MNVGKMVLGFLLMICVFTSCNTDDETALPSEQVNINDLEGEWNVTVISGGIMGSVENFNRGDVVWQFDSESETLTIQNANNLENIIIEGAFTYSILQSEGFSFLITNNQEQGLLTLSGSNLELNLGRRSNGDISDAFQISFER